MRILLFGGTGAMGRSLVDLLSNTGNEVFVTSRSKHDPDKDNIHYFLGDAHNSDFLNSVTEHRYDVIVDFMSYKTLEFSQRIGKLLSSTDQYIFLSSSRVYADSDGPITEESPRLLDVCNDMEYLSTDEYALAKAREENMLIESGRANWTIVRPYITYGRERLQLGVYEKELWLYRALNNRTIVFPKDMAQRTTSMTWGRDVARVILELIGNEKAKGETFNIVTEQNVTWGQIIGLYTESIFRRAGISLKIEYVDNSCIIEKILYSQRWQIRLDRLFNRVFSNAKVESVCTRPIEFIDLRVGLDKCVNDFFDGNHVLEPIKPSCQAYMDRVSKEHVRLNSFQGNLNRLRYICTRYAPVPIDVYAAANSRIQQMKECRKHQ